MQSKVRMLSVKTKMVWMLVLMSAVPLLLAIAVNFYLTLNNSIDTARQDSLQRNGLVEENIISLFRGFCISLLQVIHRSILVLKFERKSKFWQPLWGHYWMQLKLDRLHLKGCLAIF